MNLAELLDELSFTVLVPEHPPFGVDDVTIHPPDRRFGVPEQVHIGFASHFFGEDDRQFWLVESAEPLPERRTVKWQMADAMTFGEDRDIHPPLRIVRLERLGTHVEVRSYFLAMEDLLVLARSLVPLPEGPPPLRPPPW